MIKLFSLGLFVLSLSACSPQSAIPSAQDVVSMLPATPQAALAQLKSANNTLHQDEAVAAATAADVQLMVDNTSAAVQPGIAAAQTGVAVVKSSLEAIGDAVISATSDGNGK